MYASWGFHYRSEQSAKAQRHTNCQCVVVKDSDTDNPALEGYDPDGMRERLLQCGRDFGAEGEDWDRSMEVAGLYDREWLRTGARPEVGYASEEVWEKKWRDPKAHGFERGTAEILASHGFKTTFWDDEGRSDLDTGVEIKTIYAATSYNTFSSHISNAAKKQGLELLVVDVYLNEAVDDNQAVAWIERRLGRYPEIPGVILVSHTRDLVWVQNRKQNK